MNQFIKSHHNYYIGFIVILVAAITGFLSYSFSLRFFTNSFSSRETSNNNNVEKMKEIPITFVPVDPDYPIAIPSGTVGGKTACERLDNLRACIKNKDQDLYRFVSGTESEEGNTVEEKCGATLVLLSEIRAKSIELGCVW